MAITYEEFVATPQLKLYVERAQRVLEAERARRLQFYHDIAESDKAEFINGEVVLHSPVRVEHLRASSNISSMMTVYVKRFGLGFVGVEKQMISLTRNDYEPDICFFGSAKAAQFTPGQMLFPAPDLIVEILSPSTEKNDRGVKFEDYAAHGIQEYWIINSTARTVEQYLLDGEIYRLQIKSDSGLLKSETIPGFELPIAAIFDDEHSLKTLRQWLV